MSKLKDNSLSIYEALQNIKDGKYVMPAFQRQFVWSMQQIEKLWDTYFCEFLSEVTFDSRKQADTVNYDLTSIDVNNTDTAILDGQQRLTSLLLSLFGDAYIRPKNARRNTGSKVVTKLLIELNKNKISVDEEEYNSKKFDIKFSDKIGRLSPTQFEIKNILDEKFQDETLREKAIEEAIEEAIVNVPADSKDYAKDILQKLHKKVFVEKLVRYTEIHDMNQDDALEMFVLWFIIRQRFDLSHSYMNQGFYNAIKSI